jgi:putative flippase GtrA/GT2 family glycosyltransferase
LIAERVPPSVPDDGEGQLDLITSTAADPGPPSGPMETRGARAAASRGRHAAPQEAGPGHGKRFTIFSAIGGFIFVLGFGLQAALTTGWGVPAFVSYLVQAVVSVELSFVLNRWLTWRDRDTPLWTAFGRFNAQKTVTIALNAALYAGLLRLGLNYLVANIVLTIVFTVVNYAAGDKLVFSPRRARSEEATLAEPPTAPLPAIKLAGPAVSVVIPCRDNEATIGEAVQSLLDQDYAHLEEIILVGSPGDPTWAGLAGIDDPRLTMVEREAPPGVRDANFKRDVGVKMTSTELVALMDSDIVLPEDWLSTAVTELHASGVSCVAGGMRSIHDSFWGRYTDNTVIGAKTPRIPASYMVTSENFGSAGRKPPITANTLFSREMYDKCAIDPNWSHGSYEDYEWFWRVASAGFKIQVSRDLFGWHHHRRGMRALIKEYRRSARGCAYFIHAHLDCPFARRRRRQAMTIPAAAAAGTLAVALAAWRGEGRMVAVMFLACLGLLAAQQILRLRRLEAVAYPMVGLTLGVVYTVGLVNHLMRAPRALPARAESTEGGSSVAVFDAAPPRQIVGTATRHRAIEARRRRLFHPLLAICAVQAGLSLTLVWSNTAFGDEAEYLWYGRLALNHLLHGAALPNNLDLSGSPLLYPPIAALASDVGGLAGARLLSLLFMIAATVLLYLTATRLIGRTGALFAAGIWALTEPVMRLAFATYDPLSVLLTALSAWLIVQAGVRRRRGELVAAAAVTLALANATAFSGIVIDPVVIAFALAVWRPRMGRAEAASAAGWLTGALLVFAVLALTVTESWSGILGTIFVRSLPDLQAPSLIIEDAWQYAGLVAVIALAGAVIGSGQERRTGAPIVAGLAVLVVPGAQLAEHTGWSLDKHLAYGIWFGSIAAGYACDQLIRWLPRSRKLVLASCCALAMAYPAVNGWESAWNVYHAWANARAFVAAFRPVAATAVGTIDVPGQQYIAQYYVPQGDDWQRWNTISIALDPRTMPASAWPAYYDAQVARGTDGVIALFYAAPSGAAALQSQASLRAGRPAAAAALLEGLPGLTAGQPGISDLTAALQADRAYRLVATGPYDTDTLAGNHAYGVFAIWQKVAS